MKLIEINVFEIKLNQIKLYFPPISRIRYFWLQKIKIDGVRNRLGENFMSTTKRSQTIRCFYFSFALPSPTPLETIHAWRYINKLNRLKNKQRSFHSPPANRRQKGSERSRFDSISKRGTATQQSERYLSPILQKWRRQVLSFNLKGKQ